MEEVQAHRHGFVFGILMLCAAVLTAGFVFFPKGSIPVAEASQACPFSDGDGGTPGIQVTSNVAVSAVPTAGDYYDCTASDVTIKSGVTVTLNTNTSTGTYAEIHFANLTIESTAILDGNGKGCTTASTGPTSGNVCATSGSGGQGMGASVTGGNGGGGAGHGGIGANGQGGIAGGSTYGSPTAPVLFGAAAGTETGQNPAPGYGGGVIRLDVSGSFTHNGTIRANGTDGTRVSNWGSGGGAGGSIYITVTGGLDGTTGVFQSTGGVGGVWDSCGGSGGGGRVALTYANGSASLTSSWFNVAGGTQPGGCATTYAGAKGTVYTKNTATNAVKIFHGFSYDDTDYTATTWVTDSSATNIYCSTGATTPSVTATTITLSGAQVCDTLGTGQIFSLISSGTVTLTGFTYTGPVRSYFNISGGAAVTVASTTTVNANASWVTIASLSIDATSIVSATGKGCTTASTGPTSGNVCATSGSGGQGMGATGTGGIGGGGAGHGGIGANGQGSIAGGSTYDSPTAPVLFGAAAGTETGQNPAPGYGGGVIRFDISGDFTHNGIVRANGTNGTRVSNWGSGGGAGGSIYITTAGALNGTTGTLLAVGGTGGEWDSCGGSGAGGRVALLYANGSASLTSSWFNVSGGPAVGSCLAAAKGTVYTKNTATNAVKIFHGFSYDDTDYTATTWVTDSSATNMYCSSGTTTPSVTATTITLSGAQVCSVLSGGQAFSLSSSGTVTLDGFTYTGANRSYFNISGGAAVTLQNTSTVNASASWVTIASLSISSNSIVSANGYGCTNVGEGPNGSNVCASSGSGGQGGGGNVASGGGGGGGHGGAGGSGSGGGTGGSTYDSTTAPVLFGAAAGYATSQPSTPGAGGGVIRFSISGAMTMNGTVRANGSDGVRASNWASGGGAGGSIYVSIGTNYTCSSAPTWRAVGGVGGVWDGAGGGGGGGRIRVEYSGSDTCTSQPLSGISAGVVTAGGAAGGGGATAGSTGTFSQGYVAPPVVVTDVSHTPSSPSQTNAVTLSGTATSGSGITSILIYLDGTSAANLKKTCTFSAASPATCSMNVGTLSYGSHTTTIRASDGTNTTDGTETFTVGGPTQSGSTTLSRLAAGATSTFTMSFAFQSGTHSGPLTVTFPSAFTLNSAPQGGSSSACLGSFAFDNTAHTLSATKTSCTGTITLGGASITNPGTPGSYTISWVNDDPGSTIVAIVDSDTVSMTASVDPFITVNIGSQAAATACDGTFAGNGGTLALGSLSASTVTSSDASSVPHICIRVSTNAATGAVATVKSTNAALKSTSTPADTIDSATASPLATNTAGYGLCVGSAGGDTGRDSTTPTGALPTAASPFNGSCTSAVHNIGALTTGAQNVFTLSSPTQNAFARIYLKAGISTTTKSHTDYGDTLTFIVSGTF